MRQFVLYSPLAILLTILPLHTILKDMKKTEVQDNGSPQADEVSINMNADENLQGTQHLNEPVTDEPEIEKLKEQIQEQNDRYLRQAAEFDNFKRRNARERIELIQTASKDVVTDLLDVLDDSERAQNQMELSTGEVTQIKEGVLLVFNKLRNILSAKGLKKMEVMGKEFNPDLHEAITEMEAGADKKGKVVAEVQKGYYLNDKIIRFAKVVVGK